MKHIVYDLRMDIEVKKPVVGLASGKSRYDNVLGSLRLIEETVSLDPPILVKPNFLSANNPVAATHVDAVRAVLDFLKERTDAKVVIGEGSSQSSTYAIFKKLGYEPLLKQYGIEFRNLNRDSWGEVEVFQKNLKPFKVRIARTALDSGCRISVCPPKTHDCVVVTLSLKNMLMGCIVRDEKDEPESVGRPEAQRVSLGSRLTKLAPYIPDAVRYSRLLDSLKSFVARKVVKSDKLAMHQGAVGLNLNLFRVARHLGPHLSVIDGFTGMEGNGPESGDPVDLGVALAGTDYVAVDTLAARIMGFELADIGYLTLCAEVGMGIGDLDKIEVRGGNWQDYARNFRPHDTIEKQLAWKNKEIQSFYLKEPARSL